MTNTPLQLMSLLGQPIGTLRIGALALAAKAEEVARSRRLAKRTALPLVLREYLESAGYGLLGPPEKFTTLRTANRKFVLSSLLFVKVRGPCWR